MSVQKPLHGNMEPSNEPSSSQPSSSELPSQASQSASIGRSNLRSRWKRKNLESASKPANSEGQFSYGEIVNPSDIKETLSGKEAFPHPVASNEAAAAPVAEHGLIGEKPKSDHARTSHDHRKIERSHRSQEYTAEGSEKKESFAASKLKSHERFEDYEPDTKNAAAPDYTLDYSKHSASKKFQKPLSFKQSSKFEKTERTEVQKDKFQSHTRSVDKRRLSKKGLLEKIGGFFVGIFGTKKEVPQQKVQPEEKPWQRRSQQERTNSNPLHSSQRNLRHKGRRPKDNFNKYSKKRGSIKG